ncbi:hypothetical protein THITH_11710 [Thioalkalivibrio paradoxus ARh 1]|uniref:Uncharacterized protein n=1 Tax=Thioalkalivibrio paradoxus ARh 1 TaxID=713585 RepID=W0DNP7_9GAMM|nr:hypothetical protein THITH_11710 [Thioalkalivibrio paradoxus ARh 1]
MPQKSLHVGRVIGNLQERNPKAASANGRQAV